MKSFSRYVKDLLQDDMVRFQLQCFFLKLWVVFSTLRSKK
jgi:hypothetical protein